MPSVPQPTSRCSSVEPVSEGAPGPAPGSREALDYRDASRATLAVVLSCLGLLCLPPFSAVGLWMGVAEQRGIDQGVRDAANRRRAGVAVTIGAIGLAIWGVVLVSALLMLGLEIAPE